MSSALHNIILQQALYKSLIVSLIIASYFMNGKCTEYKLHLFECKKEKLKRTLSKNILRYSNKNNMVLSSYVQSQLYQLVVMTKYHTY